MDIDDVQHDIVVVFVARMAVCFPIRRLHVHLDIAGPSQAVDDKPCIKEIGTRVAVQLTCAFHHYRMAIRCHELAFKQLVLPHVL